MDSGANQMNLTMSAQEVVHEDLEYICRNLSEEFNRLSGNKLLIPGGAGFLGFYLVQAALHWNKNKIRTADHIDITVCDNYIRGVPAWLRALEGSPDLRAVKANITTALPEDLGDFPFVI